MKDVIQKLNECIKEGKSVVLTTIIENEGSSPRHLGSMMLSDDQGHLISGSIGGGKIELQALDDSKAVFTSEQVLKKTYELSQESELEMACGGQLTVLMQAYISPKLIIVGGGHIGKALTHYAEILDYHVTVIDHREAFANQTRFPGLECLAGDIESILKNFPITRDSYIVIVTHGHIFDEVALRTVINRNPKYIGMIGSRHKLEILRQHLLNDGISKALLNQVYAPIGLNIGGEKPAEIALSIISQIQSIRNHKETVHYKDVK